MQDQAKQLREQGMSYRQIGEVLNVNNKTVWRWLNKTNKNTSLNAEIPNAIVSSKQIKDAESNLKEFILQLTPIHYAAPPKPQVYYKANTIDLVIGDTHFGAESQNVIDLFLATVQELKPQRVILNGDTLDMFAISRYPKDVRYLCSLNKERESYHRFLKQLHDITESYSAQIIETNSNHSGDGLEGRWWRYLSDRIGELASIPEIQQKLSYENVFLPDASWSRVKLVDYVEIAPGFVVMHGDVVRKHGGYSARGLLEKWYTSIIANHTHRIGMSSQRIPSIGSQEERIIRVYENGCACDLKPLYASAANWQNAFSVVQHHGGSVSVETVVVEKGQAAIGALGTTIKV